MKSSSVPTKVRIGLPVVFAYQSLAYPADTFAVRNWLQQCPEIGLATDAETMLNWLKGAVAVKA